MLLLQITTSRLVTLDKALIAETILIDGSGSWWHVPIPPRPICFPETPFYDFPLQNRVIIYHVWS